MSKTEIDYRELIKYLPVISPFVEACVQNESMRFYLLNEQWTHPTIWVEDQFRAYVEKVDVEIRRAIASKRPAWHWVNQALWAFLATNAPAARHYIPLLLDGIQQTLLEREWYELMPFYLPVRQHTLAIISIQNYPKRRLA